MYNESIASYSYRLSANVDTNEEFVLIGLSFGGMMAVELSKSITPKLTILISSVVTRYELPAIARFFEKTKLDALIPAWMLKIPNAFLYWFFGAKAFEEKQLIRQSIAGTPSRFLKWAIHEIINWKNKQEPLSLFHIHGTKDHLLPIKNLKGDIVRIAGGGHLMVYNRADEISRILIETVNLETVNQYQ